MSICAVPAVTLAPAFRWLREEMQRRSSSGTWDWISGALASPAMIAQQAEGRQGVLQASGAYAVRLNIFCHLKVKHSQVGRINRLVSPFNVRMASQWRT